jgi:hypothetical protein
MTIDVKSLVRDDDLSKEALQRFIDKFAVHAVMPLKKLIVTTCGITGLTDAEVREELAAQGIDLDAEMAKFRPKLDELMRARAVRLALAAVKANPLPADSTSPWSANAYLWSGEKRVPMNSLHVRAHIAAAVNAAPVLAVEVERLNALLAAARVAVESRGHDTRCNAFADNAADCGCGYREASRAVGLEESHG